MDNMRKEIAEGVESREGVRGRSSVGKKLMISAAACTLALLLTACGDKVYLKDIKAADYVTLGNYVGIEASAEEPVVEDGLVDMYIQYYILPGYTTTEEVTGRAVETGDTVNIDFTGYVDGEAFEGGTAAGYDLTIGAHQFIDGFEDGLIGVKIGETVSLDLRFPDPYENNPDLAGVPVVFEVTVNSISLQVQPELTDEFVQGLGIENCSTVKELRDYVYNYFYETEVQTYENTIETTITNAAMSECSFKEPPAKMIERFRQNLRDVMNANAASMNMTLKDYMKKYYDLEPEGYEEKFRTEAMTAAQQYIMFQAIADAEGLNPTEEQIQEEIDSRVEVYDYESEEKFRESTDMEMLKEQVMRRNVMDYLKENGKIEMISTIAD